MGGGIGGLLCRSVRNVITGANAHYFYHHDGGGNVVRLTDAAQSTVVSYTYDPFGVLMSESGGSNPTPLSQPYRYSGKMWHGLSSTYDFGFRFYSPGLGRFINRDPIGEAGGLNLYGFVGNSPTNRVDPFGEKWQIPKLQLPGIQGVNRFLSQIDQAIHHHTSRVWGKIDSLFQRGGQAARNSAAQPCSTQQSFRSQMSPADAKRYQEFWERYAPRNATPGTRMDWSRISGRTGRTENSRVIYDAFGRQRYRVDYGNHMRPADHSNPHLHEYIYGPQFDPAKGCEIVTNFGR